MQRTRFEHSVKVPRLYKLAANVAKNFHEGKGSIKQLVFQQKHPNIKAIQSLVSTLVQRLDELERILKKSNFLTKEPKCSEWLAKILIVELLWGKGCLKGQSKPESTVRAYEQIFKAHLSDEKQNWDDKDKMKVSLKPRYIRVNTLLITLEDVIEGFKNEDWHLLEVEDKLDYGGFLEKVKSLSKGTFLVDIHIPNLLIFPPKTEFFKHPAYKKGYIMLQDKASCLPVHILNPPPGSIVLDMCSAPGMKTTHLAANLQNSGTVYAVERDPKRFEVLNNIVDSTGATCVKTLNRDVLTCSKTDFPDVEYILVDPSCSGSGMSDRQDFQEKLDIHRLEKLAGFQIKILRSALTRYPNVKRVVYSTCSIYTEENEDVVRQVLETNYNFKLVPGKQYLNNAWESVGSPDFDEIGEFCLYAQPKKDYTNGFFVAVFERLQEGENNQFFNNKIFNFKKDNEIQQRRQEKFKKKKLKREMEKGKSFHDDATHNDEPNSDKEKSLKIEETTLGIDNQHKDSKQKLKKRKKQIPQDNNEENSISLEERENFTEEGTKKKKKIADSSETNKGESQNCTEIPEENINFHKKSTHKKKKRKNTDSNNDDHSNREPNVTNEDTKQDMEEVHSVVNSDEFDIKKKEKYKKVDVTKILDYDNCLEQIPIVEEKSKRKKKHKKIANIIETLEVPHTITEENTCINVNVPKNEPDPVIETQHKRKKNKDCIEVTLSQPEVKIKYKKKKMDNTIEDITVLEEPEIKVKHKKKKYHSAI